jgi:uncharacterized phage protein gp47/JayE
VASAVETTRPIGTTVSVVAPTVLQVSVSLTALVPLQSASSSTIASSLQQAIQTYLNSLPIGSSAAVSRIVQAAFSIPDTIDNIVDVTLNGEGQDVTAGSMVVIKAGSITVSVNAD